MSDGSCTLWLASRSTRRRELLDAAGVAYGIVTTSIDDGVLRPPRLTSPDGWAMAMAYLKARAAAEQLRARGDGGIVLGADTVCVVGPRILGQPRDERHVTEMLELLRGRDHRTITGVALVDTASRDQGGMGRRLLVDHAIVRLGALGDAVIAAYARSGLWRGKAGGYNLEERLADGWPIEVEGDPTTVVGLPMQRLTPMLTRPP